MDIFTIHPDGRVTTDKLLLSIAETARCLGYKVGTFRNRLTYYGHENFLGGVLKPIKVGDSWRFRATDVIRLAQDPPPPKEPRAEGKSYPGAAYNARRRKKARPKTGGSK